MKDLRGSATGVTTASADDCVRFFRAVDRYPDWHPEMVRTVEVLERDAYGDPNKAHAVLHVAVGPIVKDFDLVLAVALANARTVELTRVPNHPGDDERFDVTWRLEEGVHTARMRTSIRLEVEASLSVPRFLPVGGIGDGLAQGFVSAATRALGA